ncbi:MAG: TMEM175 family protein [Actinomycetota bacterium]|nr:TMEM175 family protein [Actinomycetota bacterium]
MSEPCEDRRTPRGGGLEVVREGLARRRVGEGDFRWRGEDVSRIEAFTDAVFAFAVTLLVVSLEVPKTFDELLVDIRGFFAFAICFFLLLFVWYEHYKFFRRYGLRDIPTIWLNSALLFLVLFYVYPLKFLFTLWMDQLFGFSENEMIEASQVPLLMLIYGAGFITIQLVFVLMYLRAYSLRGALGLGAHELSVTREEIQGYLLNIAVGLASVAIAVFGGEGLVSLAGYVYLLIFPLQMINGRIMASRRKSNEDARNAARADDEGDRP